MSDTIKAGTAQVWWLGQGSFVFEGPHSGPLVVDPYLSNSCGGGGGGAERLHPVPVAPGDLTGLAGIFLTHDHQDHTDPATLPDLCAANPDTPIYSPLESVEHLQRLNITGPRVNRLERGETLHLPGVTLHTVHAEHTDDSVGLIFAFDGGPTIYHTGDTLFYENIGAEAARLEIDLMTICINGRLGNMNIADAVRVTEIVGPREVLPMHWGLFPANTADPQEFVDRLAAASARSKAVVLAPDGQARYVVAGSRAA